jgi:uncharacterized membrane protein
MSWKSLLDEAEARGVDPLGARGRLLIALAVLLVSAALLPLPNWLERGLGAWSASALTLLLLSWTVLLRATPASTRQRATAEDPGRYGVFLTVLVSSFVSLAGAIYALRSETPRSSLLEGLAVAAVVLGWLVTHTGYTFRYARIYYAPDERGEPKKGLSFPGDEAPDDMDFAYFSFTLGMAFQVSDVTVTSSDLRRTVLFHSLQSFVFNTIIVALALNFLFGSIGG